MAKVNTSIETLANLKLQVILFHTGFDGLQSKIAADACYTSSNALRFKKVQIADALGDFETAVKNNDILREEKVGNFIERLHLELAELTTRHAADLVVYKQVTDGKDWQANSKTPNVLNKDAIARRDRFAALKSQVAA